jgi:hypothetical protein
LWRIRNGPKKRGGWRRGEDAAKAGISAADLDAAVEGDLTGNMTTALAAAAFRRMAVEQWADEE